MTKFLSTAFVAVILTATAFSASAATTTTKAPAHRSEIQKECAKDNAKDHKAYLACVKSKNEAKKADSATPAVASTPAASTPVTAPVTK